MTSRPATLVDTNILVYGVYPAAEHHEASRALLETARDPLANLYLAPQNVSEFIATVTNPRRVTEPKTIEEAIEAVETFMSRPGLSTLVVPVDVVTLHTEALREIPVAGPRIFDAQLVAVMRGNGVSDISTFNVKDFEGYAGINVHLPTV